MAKREDPHGDLHGVADDHPHSGHEDGLSRERQLFLVLTYFVANHEMKLSDLKRIAGNIAGLTGMQTGEVVNILREVIGTISDGTFRGGH